MVQTDDYYPFGMQMGGLGYKRADLERNDFLYQSQELLTDFELGLYSFELRNYDPSLGRWLTTDPADQFASPYLSMGNNPIMNVDPDGAYSEWGARWRNIFYGGSGIYKSGGEWGFNIANGSAERINGEMIQGFTSKFGKGNFDNMESVSFDKLDTDFNRQLGSNELLRSEFGLRNGIEPVQIEFQVALLATTWGIGTAAQTTLNTAAKAGTNVAAKGVGQAEKASGSYLLQFQSGKFYAGKGLQPRMMQSINRIETTYGDKLLNSQFFPASSTRGAFINEHNLMMQFGGPKSFNPLSPTYNKIFSPGRKLGGV